jgi:hypothetical protein
MLRNAKQEAEEWRVAALAWADEAERLRGLETENERLRAALRAIANNTLAPGACTRVGAAGRCCSIGGLNHERRRQDNRDTAHDDHGWRLSRQANGGRPLVVHGPSQWR